LPNPANPQSWNRYAYVLNDPLSSVDPTGLDCVYLDNNGALLDIERGDCISAADNGYYVDGTIDTTQLIDWSADGNSITFTFTNGAPGSFCFQNCDSLQIPLDEPLLLGAGFFDSPAARAAKAAVEKGSKQITNPDLYEVLSQDDPTAAILQKMYNSPVAKAFRLLGDTLGGFINGVGDFIISVSPCSPQLQSNFPAICGGPIS
jgi:hypothetical protein